MVLVIVVGPGYVGSLAAGQRARLEIARLDDDGRLPGFNDAPSSFFRIAGIAAYEHDRYG